MKCSRCGSEIANGNKFCQNCGLPLETTSLQQNQQPKTNQASQKLQKAWYKKWWIWFLMGLGTIMLLFNMTCTCALLMPSTKSSNTNATKNEAVIVETKSEESQLEIQTPTEIQTETPPEKAENVIYDDNGIKIVCLGTEEAILGTNVKFRIENNSEYDYVVYAKDISVNRYMINGWLYSRVKSGKVVNDKLYVSNSVLEENGISSIDEIELVFDITNKDKYSLSFDTESITFKP